MLQQVAYNFQLDHYMVDMKLKKIQTDEKSRTRRKVDTCLRSNYSPITFL